MCVAQLAFIGVGRSHFHVLVVRVKNLYEHLTTRRCVVDIMQLELRAGVGLFVKKWDGTNNATNWHELTRTRVQMSHRAKRVLLRVLRWGACACILGGLLAMCWHWMRQTIPQGITIASVSSVVCFYMLVLMSAALCFFGCHRAFRNPLVKCGAFALLFVWGCVAYFFHPVDRHRVRNVTMEERIRVRSIESPNRVVAAFFPSRGGFEFIGENSSAIHYFAFHASVVFFITCLMFSFFGRGIVNKALAIFARRRLDVFWGVSEQALLLAESIMTETHDHEVLFRLPMSLRGDKDKLLEVTHSIEDIGCFWELSDFRIDNKNGFAKWCLLIGVRHFFMLGSGHENVAQANKIARASGEHVQRKPKECYLRISTAEDRRIYEKWCNDENVKKTIEPIIIDESEMVAWDFAQKYSRLKCPTTKIDGKCGLLTDFNVLLIGLGKTGTAVLNEIVCNGQLLKSGSRSATGLAVRAIDRDKDAILRFEHSHPGFKNGIEEEIAFSLDCMDVFSSQFDDWVSENIGKYDQVVLCLPSDADNISVAERIRTIQRTCDLSQNQIVVKIGNANVSDTWKTADCGRFGNLRDLYQWQKIDASHVTIIAKAKHSKWESTANDTERAAADKRWRNATYAKRQSSRASAKGEFNFVELLGYAIDFNGGKQDERVLNNVQGKINACLDILARNEHLRWNAYHVMLGYQRWDMEHPSVNVIKPIKANQLESLNRHADIVPYDCLPEVDYRIKCAENQTLRDSYAPADFVGDASGCAQSYDRDFCRSMPSDIFAAGFRIVQKEDQKES